MLMELPKKEELIAKKNDIRSFFYQKGPMESLLARYI